MGYRVPATELGILRLMCYVWGPRCGTWVGTWVVTLKKAMPGQFGPRRHLVASGRPAASL